MWDYYFDGEVIARLYRADNDPPYLGMPVYMVGRDYWPAPVEEFVVSAISEKRLDLERSE